MRMIIPHLNGFIESLAYERRLSTHTQTNYQKDISDLWQFTPDLNDWNNLNVQHLRLWIAHIHNLGHSGRSIARKLSALRTFFRYLNREGICAHNPATLVKAPKFPKKLPKVMDVDQLCGMLSQTPNDPLQYRDLAMLELTYACGLRLSELHQLNVDATYQSTLKVMGKGQKERLVPVGNKAKQAIVDYLPYRQLIASPEEKALFVSKQGKRLSVRAIQMRFKQWAQHFGQQHLHPHMMRHAFASHILESSGDLKAVQELLGHANLSTTQVYTHLDYQHLSEVYDQSHPRAKKKNT